MASNGSIPPPIADVPNEEKFDGGVCSSWTSVRRKIVSALESQGLDGYIDGTVTIPTSVPTVVLSPPTSDSSNTNIVTPPAPAQQITITSTPVYSARPTLEEYRFRNSRARAIVSKHIEDILALVPEVDTMTAREVFMRLDREYLVKNEARKIATNRDFRNFLFDEQDTLDQFFKDIREKRKIAIEAGNHYSDSEFRSIILGAFPTGSFDTIIQNITTNSSHFTTSASVIQEVTSAYRRVEDRKTPAAAGNQITPQAHAAIVAKVEELEKKLLAAQARKSKSDIVCHNCGRKGHIKADCFRKGGGKEGQFPSWWRGRKDTEPANNSPSANLAVGDPDAVQRFAMNATKRHGIPANATMDSCIYADSGATDHFLRSRSDFVTYTLLSKKDQTLVQGSESSSTFRIIGVGKARKTVWEDRKKVVMEFEEACHTPNAAADLTT